MLTNHELLSELERRIVSGSLDEEYTFMLRRVAALPGKYYGDGGTIHSSGKLDVQMNSSGRITMIWFRCMNLPFECSNYIQEAECNPEYGIQGIIVDHF